MNRYLLFNKERLPLEGRWTRWDLFLSAFNSSERVKKVFAKASARHKRWLILPEYGYDAADHPQDGDVYVGTGTNEAEIISTFLNALNRPLDGLSIAVDITGFISHYVLVLLAILQRSGVSRVDILYAEPIRYVRQERTKFSDEAVLEVRQVAGFEGSHNTDTNNDLLVIAVGYDYRLVSEVANYKDHASKLQLFGLPSLRPDMYQESIIAASRVANAVGPEASHPQHFRYAPANDPFTTAGSLASIVNAHRARYSASNVYLSPLSTKAQALGFGLYYVWECQESATSIVFPICRKYSRETTEGISGVWRYQVELPRFQAPAPGALQ